MSGQAERASDLGDRVNGHPEAVPLALPELEEILRAPDDAEALTLAIEALGHAWESRAAELLLELVDPDHAEPMVRAALARALPGGAGDDPERTRAIDILVHLSADQSAEVRDWSCFGLGQLEADTPAVRDALAARLADDDADTRAEALVALAELGDGRALPSCISALTAEDDAIGLLTLKAAAALADPSLIPALKRLQDGWQGDVPDDHTAALGEALSRCEATLTR